MARNEQPCCIASAEEGEGRERHVVLKYSMTSRHLSCGKRALNIIRGSDSFSATKKIGGFFRRNCEDWEEASLKTRSSHATNTRTQCSAWIGCGVWETGGRGRPTHQSNDCLFVYICERRKASKHLIQRETTTTTTTEAVPARIQQRRWTRTPQ